jgi:murein DD-endopeptidase MepM/ murein hydrolase activator NlpD
LDRTKLVSRAGALILSGTLILGGLVAAAHADNAIGRALHERKVTVHKLERIHDLRRVARQNLHHQISAIQHRIHKTRITGPSLGSDRARWSKNQEHLTRTRHGLRQRLVKLERFVRRRTVVLRTQRLSLTQWVQTYGIFRECPVDGTHEVANNFGVWVILPDVPKHIHQGNDITASSGTPIVAPFDGVAEASSNTLGGLAVKVFGDQGYVYNAHLSAYGTLGDVKAGTVIGYVGSTGDAAGPHDHFEWHPGNGSAVDPYPYLMAVC